MYDVKNEGKLFSKAFVDARLDKGPQERYGASDEDIKQWKEDHEEGE